MEKLQVYILGSPVFLCGPPIFDMKVGQERISTAIHGVHHKREKMEAVEVKANSKHIRAQC